MYKVYWGSYLLHDLTIPEEEGYYLQNPKLTEEVNKVAEFTFNIYDTHPMFDRLEKLVPNIIVTKNDRVIFEGRIIKEKQLMDNSKQVTCESVLAFLFDSVVRPYNFQGSPEELLTQFINNHNEQVEDYKRFVIGSTTGSNLDTNEYINRNNESYTNTYDEITSKLLNIGGYFYVRYESDGNYIDWVDDFKTENGLIASAQRIEFGENLIDITVENDGADIYTVVIPLGYEVEEKQEETPEEENPEDEIETIEETTTETTKKRLTIESVNDGKDYLVNEEALNKYGWIVAPIEETTWDDVTEPDNLKRKGQELLDTQGVKFKSTLELKAIDLNVVDSEEDDFKMYEYIIVQSTPHGISKTYLLTKKETPLTNPENMLITLGETKATLSGMQFESDKTLKEQINTIKIIERNYVTNQAVTDVTNTLYSYIDQKEDQIQTTVRENFASKSEFEEYQETIESKFTQTKDSFEMTFSEIVQSITNLDGTVNSNYNELIKYIRFVGGTITLGEAGNPLILTLSNDRMSFLQNGIEVAYISDNKLYIYDGEFLNSLTLGRWVYIIEQDQSLSLNFV